MRGVPGVWSTRSVVTGFPVPIRTEGGFVSHCWSYVRFVSSVSWTHGCPLSLILFKILMDRIFRYNEGPEGFWLAGIGISSLIFANDVALLASSGGDPQLLLERFAARCEEVGVRISTSKSETDSD